MLDPVAPFSPESVITSLAGFAAVQSVGGTWVGVGIPRPQRPGPRTAMSAAFRYALTVSRRTPVCCSMRRKDQPSCPSTMICCCFFSFKTLLMAREPKRLRCAVNVSNASTVGRFWVITEARQAIFIDRLCRLRNILHRGNCLLPRDSRARSARRIAAPDF